MLPQISFFGLTIPTYFLYLGLLFSFLVLYVSHRADSFEVDIHVALNLGLVIMVAGFIGARAFHVLYEQPELYREQPSLIFQFWMGGFVFYGGAILALVCSILYLQVIKQPFWNWADFYAPVLALGYSLGRVSCFLAGCCFGKTCDLPWGVHFPFDPNETRHPTQLYATVMEFWFWWILIILGSKDKIQRRPGTLFLIYGVLHSLGRLTMEYFRDDNRGPSLGPLSISSAMSLALLLTAASILLLRPICVTENK